MKKITIAIDGPAAAGKSTVAKIVAQKLSYQYLDTGAMYRAFTYKLLKLECDLTDERNVEKHLIGTEIEFNDTNEVVIDHINVSKEIRFQNVSQNVSLVSSYKSVRYFMVDIQRKLSLHGGVVVDGRDIGSYVLPKAELKIYQTASVNSRAKRRFLEAKTRQEIVDLEEIKKDIIERDFADSNREFAPLKKAKDAIEIDTSDMTLESVVSTIVSFAKAAMEEVS